MGKLHNGLARIVFIFCATSILLSSTTQAYSQSAEPLRTELLSEPISAPPMQVPYTEGYPVPNPPLPMDSATFAPVPLAYPGLGPTAAPAAYLSATFAPVTAADSEHVISQSPRRILLIDTQIQGWFAQIDYFVWSEYINSERILEETGPLLTVGYRANKNRKKYRFALFGGNLDYDGGTWDGEPSSSNTDYIGIVAEYDFRFPLAGRPQQIRIFPGPGHTTLVAYDT